MLVPLPFVWTCPFQRTLVSAVRHNFGVDKVENRCRFTRPVDVSQGGSGKFNTRDELNLDILCTLEERIDTVLPVGRCGDEGSPSLKHLGLTQ